MSPKILGVVIFLPLVFVFWTLSAISELDWMDILWDAEARIENGGMSDGVKSIRRSR